MSHITSGASGGLLLSLVLPQDQVQWQDEALCAQTDPELFFPEKGGSPRAAQKICGRCPVQDECLEWALGSGESYGVWGGASERQRRKMTTRKAA